MAQSPLLTSSMTHHVTPRMFSPSTLTIASVSRSAIWRFWSGVKTSSITLTLMRGMGRSLLRWTMRTADQRIV